MTNLLFRKPNVGKEVTAYCGRCKDERTHVVTAMDGDSVKRVTCSTCGSTHNFKQLPASRQKPRERGTRTQKKAGKTETFTIDPRRPVKNYDMQTSFAVGDVINHPKFGLGEVQTSISPNKIEVRFSADTKLLLHGMKNR
jgi:Zn ribbon nucleic-acid-binding protein